MLVIDESAAGHLDLQGAHFDGALELLLRGRRHELG